MKVEIMKDRDKGFMSNTSYDLWQKVGSYKTVLYCPGCDLQKSCYLKQCSFSSNFCEEKFVLNNFFVSKSWIYPEKLQIVWRLSYHIIQNEFLGYSEWKGIVLGMSFQVWHFKGEKKITSLHSYLNRSMPGILIGTLTNLLQSVQKYLSVRTLTIQKPVKWFGMQNKLLVSKWFTY